MKKLIRDVLYVIPHESRQAVRRAMLQAGGRATQDPPMGEWIVVHAGSQTIRFFIATSVDRALELILDRYFDFLVTDSRHLEQTPRTMDGSADESAASPPTMTHRLIDKLHYSGNPDQRFPLSQVIAVLSVGPSLAKDVFRLGQLQIGGYVTEPFAAGELFEVMDSLQDTEPGKVAICLSGGGLEGFLFELGVMMGINAHLQTRSVVDADIFCGISAGSILAAFLANRMQPEIIASVMTGDVEQSNIEPLTPGVLYDPHFREYAQRLWSLGKALPMRSWSELISGVLKAVPIGFFRGQSLFQFIERQLTRPGRTNDFRELETELYIGATEQDTSQHTIFGANHWSDVPISQAVRASTALTPFFEPVKIRGRYFVDGQYTRTSNFHLAVEHGAKLVIVVDPMIPIRVERPGYVKEKGGVFGGLQALKAVVHTRFMHAFQAAIDEFPKVNFVLFKPEGDLMRLMSGSPMKYSVRTEIINMAYRYTVRRIQRDFELLDGVFSRHGVPLQRNPRLRGRHSIVH